jgi:hypothetical protein
MYVSYSIVAHLETLKTEAAEIARKVEETDVVMAEVETVSQQYVPLAQSCSGIYFTLESLYQVNLHSHFNRPNNRIFIYFLFWLAKILFRIVFWQMCRNHFDKIAQL